MAAHRPERVTPSPPGRDPQRLLLAQALLAVAREHSFPSWPKLKAHVEALATHPASTTAAPSTTAPASRASAARDLALESAGLALQGDALALAALFSRLPLRDILVVRAALAGTTAYTALVDALLAGLDHPDSRVRYNTAQALDHLADERCLAPLRRLADDPVPRVRRMALHALGCERRKLTPLPVPPDDDLVGLLVERALAGPSISVRRHATAGLGGCCHDHRAVAALKNLLARETDAALLRNARWALARQGAPRTQDTVLGPIVAPSPPGSS
jgi:hypothetical protein